MNVNNNIGIKNSFMYKKININEISITNKSNNLQNNFIDEGVILELSSPRVKLENVEPIDTSIEKYFEYGKMFIAAKSSGSDYKSCMMNMIEKYYSIDEELKEKYADNEKDYNRYKAWLDKAFDEQTAGSIYNTAAQLTYPLMWLGLRTSDTAKRDEITQLQSEYVNSFQNDIEIMFKNMKNYYDINKSFDGMTNSIISENCVALNYDDLDYMHSLNEETQIDDKIKNGYMILDKDGRLNDEERNEFKNICKDINGIIDNMNCSDIFKQMYRQILKILQEKAANIISNDMLRLL